MLPLLQVAHAPLTPGFSLLKGELQRLIVAAQSRGQMSCDSVVASVESQISSTQSLSQLHDALVLVTRSDTLYSNFVADFVRVTMSLSASDADIQYVVYLLNKQVCMACARVLVWSQVLGYCCLPTIYPLPFLFRLTI